MQKAIFIPMQLTLGVSLMKIVDTDIIISEVSVVEFAKVRVETAKVKLLYAPNAMKICFYKVTPAYHSV